MDAGAVATVSASRALVGPRGVAVVGGAMFTADGYKIMRIDGTSGVVSRRGSGSNRSLLWPHSADSISGQFR